MNCYKVFATVALATACLGVGCSSDGDDASDAGNRFGNAGAGSGESGGGAGTTGGGGSGGNGSGANGVGDLIGDAACKRVDLVIAVDGSGSMTEELESMRRTIFPAFADRLQTLGAGLDDFRVATLDACPAPANFHTRGRASECNFAGGNAWIESSSPNIEAEFACVGDIFQDDQQCSGDNDDEQPASAAATALEGANPGFQRDDALLIVVAITDEDEQPTGDAQSAEEVYARYAQIVGQDPRRMVFLGIGGSDDCNGVYGSADEASLLRDITALFEVHNRGVFWDLCQGRLEDGLEQAFQVIERACTDFCGDLDEDCGSGGTGGGTPVDFCLEFPNDPACMLD